MRTDFNRSRYGAFEICANFNRRYKYPSVQLLPRGYQHQVASRGIWQRNSAEHMKMDTEIIITVMFGDKWQNY